MIGPVNARFYFMLCVLRAKDFSTHCQIQVGDEQSVHDSLVMRGTDRLVVGALPLDPMELTRDLKNRCKPSLN
ncbi:hypothetical protein GOODEAATRI_013135 [Goodea atripinnis]|uniref:Uncharacterized protein n=1 Tax=Goodea atripinnis TaxID=208336 RepID=A0ABV0MHD6_9TELE